MKVILANPPAYIHSHSRHFIQAGSRWSHTHDIPKGRGYVHGHPYPFFLCYASSLLQEQTDCYVEVVDGCALDMDEEEFLNHILFLAPDLVVIELPTISFDLMLPILKKIKERTTCSIVITGFHISACYKEVLQQYSFIDYVLLGEYEQSLLFLVKSIIAGRKSRRLIMSALIKNLDMLPYPDRDSVPLDQYYNQVVAGVPCIYMWATRGCPMSCGFCLERNVLYNCNIYRKRSACSVVDEMEYLVNEYAAKQINFDDMTFTADHRYVQSICNEIISSKLDIAWWAMVDMNLDFTTLDLMRSAGCVKIAFGVETIDAEMLKMSKKTFVNTNKAFQFKKHCDDIGIKTHATYIVGLPGDTAERARRTVDFAIELNTDTAQWAIATPYPGTPFFATAKKNDWLMTDEWIWYDGTKYSVISYPDFSWKEIEENFKNAIDKWGIHCHGYVPYQIRKYGGRARTALNKMVMK